ncbi:MAG: 1,6-anhydro-N-acetylmuramyl-L-alanine amidase AmpD [Panacagrimonas sp.]
MSASPSSACVVDDEHRLGPGVRRVDSPHCDARPDADDIALVVIHNISLPPGEFGGPWIDHLFIGTLDPTAHPYFQTLRDTRVSAHLCIFRDGEMTQYVPFDKRAWHAGVSNWQGRERCNDFSIGIELEGSDHVAFAPAQYQRLVQVLLALFARYPRLGSRKLTGHSDIAPGRKTDPGPYFDWAHLHALMAAAA